MLQTSRSALRTKSILDLKEEASDLRRGELEAKTQQRVRERDRHKNRTSIHNGGNAFSTTIQAWYLYPQPRVEAFVTYYNYGPSTYGQCEHGY
jgi:hypothetical protein